MTEHRPSPEKLLQRVKEEERKETLGKLKIYLGAAPGVGKTYHMLQDAASAREQGLDVVIGIIETHGRHEIENLVKELEIIPRKQIPYHQQTLSEFDLDGALKRNPGIILVDEMAHTNAPGLRHIKRWQDIKELLDRGIDVYTTLNVQHIESLNDIVSQITHTRIKETIPDFMLELADTIELVDLPPEDLLKRLQEGKVYIPAQAELAIEHFFRKGNLIALRELALRVTAERVGEQVLLYRQGKNIQHIWPSQEKILVYLDPRMGATKLIRAAKRMATNLKTEWTVVYVDRPHLGLEEEARNLCIQHLRFAEQLGADTKILSGTDIVTEIINFAREQNVTRIVIGKPMGPWLKRFLMKNFVNKLIKQSGEIDIYLLEDTSKTNAKSELLTELKTGASLKTYLATIAITAIVTGINFLIFKYFKSHINTILLYLLGIIVIARFGEALPAILGAILSVLAYDFFFLPPYYSFLTNANDFVTLVFMLLISLIISHLTILGKKEAKIARLAEQRTAILHSLSRKLAGTRGVDKLLEIAYNYLGKVFDSDIIALLWENDELVIRKYKRKLNEKEMSIAQWVYELGQAAGLGTNTLSFANAMYLPLSTSQHPFGVLRVQPNNNETLFTPEQIHLLEACVTQIALALEVDRFQEKNKQSELQTVKDHVRDALIASVSHDLRAPLLTVMAAARTLLEMGDQLPRKKIKQLGQNVYLELEELNRLIHNLLQITHLESQYVKLQKKSANFRELIETALKMPLLNLKKRDVEIIIPDPFPLIPLDETLIEEVLENLLDNALKFTPDGSPIKIIVQLEKELILVSIFDKGPGIAPDEVNKLFEKYYRGRLLTTEYGLGLGLAICQRIIHAHGGKIWAENREDGGAVFKFTLPIE